MGFPKVCKPENTRYKLSDEPGSALSSTPLNWYTPSSAMTELFKSMTFDVIFDKFPFEDSLKPSLGALLPELSSVALDFESDL